MAEPKLSRALIQEQHEPEVAEFCRLLAKVLRRARPSAEPVPDDPSGKDQGEEGRRP